MEVRGAIFDVDGTLLDSLSIWDTAGSDYLISIGKEPEENVAQIISHMSLTQAAIYFQETYDVKMSVDEIIAGINSVVRTFYLEKVQLLPGVRDFLEILAKTNIKMIAATVSDKELIRSALKRCGIDGYFVDILTCEEVGAGKDNPKIYNEALSLLGTSKDNTIVFEDAEYALNTAKSAGFITRQVGGTIFCHLTKIMQQNGGI